MTIAGNQRTERKGIRQAILSIVETALYTNNGRELIPWLAMATLAPHGNLGLNEATAVPSHLSNLVLRFSKNKHAMAANAYMGSAASYMRPTDLDSMILYSPFRLNGHL